MGAGHKHDKDANVPTFDHNDTKHSRAQKWDTWSKLLVSVLSSLHPFLAAQMLVRPDPDEPDWGIKLDPIWFPERTHKNARESAQLYATAQAKIYSMLHKNFSHVEKKILEDCNQPSLRESIQTEYSLADNDRKLMYLPFGNLAFHMIADKYKEKGVTQSITRLQRFEKAKEFDPKDVELLGHLLAFLVLRVIINGIFVSLIVTMYYYQCISGIQQ